MVRLFEKNSKGLLVEVDPAEAEAKRAGRTVSHMNLTAEVLWTPEEEAAREAEKQEASAQLLARETAANRKSEVRQAALTKIQALGLSEDELKALVG